MTSNDSSMPCILVIDDNEDILAFLDEILRNSGYRSLTASSGKQGLELLLEESPDLVVLDREMPEMNGYKVAGAIRGQRPEMPLILYTGYRRMYSEPCAVPEVDSPLLRPLLSWRLRFCHTTPRREAVSDETD